MARKRELLKWRKCKGGWRAGPFSVVMREWDGRAVVWSAYLEWDKIGSAANIAFACATPEEAKSACESLARKIIAATKGRHGK